MSKEIWKSPLYPATDAVGEKHMIDVTQSISAGLKHNEALVGHIIGWMKERGFTRVLDFGAGALRHTLALLDAGLEVTAVEFKQAYSRDKAGEKLKAARSREGFIELYWPSDFLKKPAKKYDVAVLAFVLQVVPNKTDRVRILKEVAKRLDPIGPQRIYYASRFGDAKNLKDDRKYKDGWIRGSGAATTFYTEWNAAETHAFMKKRGFVHAGRYGGSAQPFIYERNAGL